VSIYQARHHFHALCIDDFVVGRRSIGPTETMTPSRTNTSAFGSVPRRTWVD